METYKILWLDDDFNNCDIYQPSEKNDNRIIFQEDVEMFKKFGGFEVVGVKNFEEFKAELANINRYQAVIFDLNGMTSNGIEELYVAHDAMDLLLDTKILPTYIYSSNTEQPNHEAMLRKLKEKERVFNKGNGCKCLYEKVRMDLDDNLHYYEGHQECLYLFQLGYLDGFQNRYYMDDIMFHFNHKDITYSPYNPMRNILEEMIKKLSEKKEFKGLCSIKGALSEVEPFNECVFYITKKSHELDEKKKTFGKSEKRYDYNNPMIPFYVMRRDVKYTLSFLADMANNFSHYVSDKPNFLNSDESVRLYNSLMQESVYSAFFIVMRWYYNFMSKTGC